MSESWTKDIEDHVKQTLGAKSNGDKMGGKDYSQFFLFGIIIALAVAVFWVLQSRGGNFLQSQQQQPYNNYYSQWDNAGYSPYTLDYPMAMPAEQRIDRLESAARKIWERTKWNSDRITLLGTINNHNTVVIKRGLPRSELILLNGDWTINRMPNRIYLDYKDKEFLKKYVK